MTDDEQLIADLETATAVLGRLIDEAKSRPLTDEETAQMRTMLASARDLRALITVLISDDDASVMRELMGPAPEGSA